MGGHGTSALLDTGTLGWHRGRWGQTLARDGRVSLSPAGPGAGMVALVCASPRWPPAPHQTPPSLSSGLPPCQVSAPQTEDNGQPKELSPDSPVPDTPGPPTPRPMPWHRGWQEDPGAPMAGPRSSCGRCGRRAGWGAGGKAPRGAGPGALKLAQGLLVLDGPGEAVGAWGGHERALSRAFRAVTPETARQAAAPDCVMVTRGMGVGRGSSQAPRAG